MKKIPLSVIFDPDQVYQPETDTYLLLDVALKEFRSGDRILEIGTGSGYIAAGIMGLIQSQLEGNDESSFVVGTDINPHAVRCAREKGVEVVRTRLFDGLRGSFDLIVFNPPYLPTLDEEKIDDWLEYALDGGPDGRAVLSRFAKEVGMVLAPGGRVLLLISSLTGEEAVIENFTKLSYKVEIVTKRRVFDEELIVLRIRKNESFN
ncbi:MAG: class I SAM-dependent methyltransferase [Methanomicrobiales archaeon]|nr:class I SAM-dependent methyltransferase [Methanomicrobiales archaeon]